MQGDIKMSKLASCGKATSCRSQMSLVASLAMSKHFTALSSGSSVLISILERSLVVPDVYKRQVLHRVDQRQRGRRPHRGLPALHR